VAQPVKLVLPPRASF